MDKRILITGANGFIGANLSNHLLNKGYTITCLVRPDANTSLLHPLNNIIYIDYNDDEILHNIISNHEIIIHLAAKTRDKTFDHMFHTNVTLTEKIINVVNASPICKQVIFLSSQAASGPSESNHKKNEEEMEYPVNWYGNSKLLAEIKVKACSKHWTILRPCSVFGDGDKDFLVYFKMIRRHISPIPGINTKYISLIYIQDLVNVIERCIDNPAVYNQLMNVSDNNSYTFVDVINTLKKVIGTYSLFIKIPNKLIYFIASIFDFLNFKDKALIFNKQKAIELSQESWLVDSSKAFHLLNLQPFQSLQENLKKTYTWYLENHCL